MIRKRWTIILLAITLVGCSDSNHDKSEDKDNQKSSRNASGMDILKIESPRDKKVPKPVSPPTAKAPLPVMLPNDSFEDRDEDAEDIGMEDVEQYREDYDKAGDVADKIEALTALVQADEKNAVPLLQEAYESPEPEIRKEAVLLMQDYSDNKQIVDLMLSALNDPDKDVVIEAIEGLSGLDNKRAMESLKDAARSHPDKEVREAAQEYVDQESEE